MVLIYRVEKEGKGFYSSPKSNSLQDYTWANFQFGKKHPSPSDDLILGKFWRSLYLEFNHRPWHFGFESEKQMKNGFILNVVDLLCIKTVLNLSFIASQNEKLNLAKLNASSKSMKQEL